MAAHADPYTEPDFASIALITIDTQRDTLDGGALEVTGTSAILPRMRELTSTFRAARMPIVHVVRIYTEDGSNVDLSRRGLVETGALMLRPGSSGCELAIELLPDPDVGLDSDLLMTRGIQRIGPNEVIMYKPRWGAFYRTALEEHLRQLKVTSLVFAGCNFQNCPRASIYEASERDFRIVIAADAVSGVYRRGIEELRAIGVHALTTRQIAQRVGPTKTC